MPKVYLEFGVGNNFDLVLVDKSLRGYYTITIDKKKSPILNQYKHYIDEYIVGDWNDEHDIQLADEWSCISCFEHIEPEMVDESIQGIIRKVKKDSIGYVHIDLSDHHGGFKHYEDMSKFIEETGYAGIKNVFSHKKWLTIFEKYFILNKDDVSIEYFDGNDLHPKSIGMYNLKVK